MAPHDTGYHEQITKEKCLECALTRGHPPCGFDYTLLKYVYSHNRYRALDIHVSDLLICPRRSWYEKKIEYPTTASEKLIVTFGTLQHAMLEEMEDEHYKAESIVEAGSVVGTADVFYPKTSFRSGRLVDYKTKRKANPRYLPEKKHIIQLQIYAFLLREMGEEVETAAIQYIDFFGPSRCPKCKTFAVPGDVKGTVKCSLCNNEIMNGHLGALLYEVELMKHEDVERLVKERTSYLEEALQSDTPPDRVETDFLCRYCPFLELCKEGQQEVHSAK